MIQLQLEYNATPTYVLHLQRLPVLLYSLLLGLMILTKPRRRRFAEIRLSARLRATSGRYQLQRSL